MNDKKKTILIGNSSECKKAYAKLKPFFNVVACVNQKDKPTNCWEIPCISFEDMTTSINEEQIVICDVDYYSVGDKLRDNGIYDFMVFLNGFLYHTGVGETMQPIELYENDTNCGDGVRILYVCDIVDKRICEYSRYVRKRGYTTTLLCINENECGEDIFDNSISATTMRGYCDFLNKGGYSIVHCVSNSPIIANLLKGCNVPIVYESRENGGSVIKGHMEEIVLNYIINRYSTAYVYKSEIEREVIYRQNNIINNSNVLISDEMIEKRTFGELLNLLYASIIDNAKR